MAEQVPKRGDERCRRCGKSRREVRGISRYLPAIPCVRRERSAGYEKHAWPGSTPENQRVLCVGWTGTRACREWRGLRPCGCCARHCETRKGGNCGTPCDGIPADDRR